MATKQQRAAAIRHAAAVVRSDRSPWLRRAGRREQPDPLGVTPTLRFHADERWFPVGVEEGLAAVGVEVPPVAKLDLPATMKPVDLPPVGYHEAFHARNLYWHRFWFFYLYNPWSIAGIGRHEGDWEFVQFGCVDERGAEPVLATYSQHHGGGKREFWTVEMAGARPVAYSALGSHANYFQPGVQGDGIDRCGGGREISEFEWREAADQPWWNWGGRWGNSDNSPESPGRQRRDAALFHSRAKA